MASTEIIGIIGAGAAGLITAQVLIQDGFNVQLITRDRSVGGVWSEQRIYPNLALNSVYGEYRFSSLSMPLPTEAAKTGGRLTGEGMSAYFEHFADRYLRGKIKFETEVVGIRRIGERSWIVDTSDGQELSYSRIVLCTGGCSKPKIPDSLSTVAAEKVKFSGLVIHSSQFGPQLEKILSTVAPISDGPKAGSVVVVGGGKSATDISAYLCREGRKVTIVYDAIDALLTAPKPLPDFIRKSRLLGVLSPHIELRTRLERFLHTTWLGSKFVNFFWNKLVQDAYKACGAPEDSPLRLAHNPFWSIRASDEGVHREDRFHGLVNAGKIEVMAPARVERFSDDGLSLLLSNGLSVPADAVILATGYTSSWEGIFDEDTAAEIGIGRHPPTMKITDTWNYTSMANPPPSRPESQQWSSSIYRGLVPAKNIGCRDFAINGAIFTINNGYTFEVAAHWISSYFLEDRMRLPATPHDALVITERNSAWIKRRHPEVLSWASESYTGNLAFFTYPQAVDELLEDMDLPTMRSGGNWLTWIFKTIDTNEIATLAEERRAKRAVGELETK